MSTNWILVLLLVVLVTLSVFIPSTLGDDYMAFGTNSTNLPSSPSVWDVLSFNAAWIWDVMTLEYPETFPFWLSMVFWCGTFLFIYCAVRLVRGTS